MNFHVIQIKFWILINGYAWTYMASYDSINPNIC